MANDGSILATTVFDSEGNESRYYPNGRLLCHTLGYVGNGGSGLENSAAYYMLTSNDNLWDKISNDMAGKKNFGDSIVTTLDVELSKVAYEALGKNIGSVVILEPSTGKILTMISTPDFEPNTINEDWETVSKDAENAVLLNRATQGLYPPGSVFKLVTLLEYYRENSSNYLEYQYLCDGTYELLDTGISCAHKTAHGNQDVMQALANSCNGAFVDMGLKLDIKKYANTANELLFNQKLPLNMEYNISQFLLDESSTEWEIAQTSFGQGETLVTPIHLAMICSSIANNGKLQHPYMIEKVINDNGKEITKFNTPGTSKLMTEADAKLLQDGMKNVVDTSFEWLYGNSAYTLAGKSGTAQYGSNGYEHSLFMSYSPAEKPEIVVVVVLEGGPQQKTSAAEVTKQIYDFYYFNR